MEWQQIKGRCPSARYVGVAKLPDHYLAFTRKSNTRLCGVADAVQEPGRDLWGVVFEISEVELAVLDKCEGYQPGRERNSYWRRECTVFLDGDEDRPITGQTYFAERESNAPLPNQAYKALILSGARQWHLPEAYIDALEAIEVRA